MKYLYYEIRNIMKLAVSPSAQRALGDTARPMIQDFQQLTARRIEGQCFYCTTNAFAYKNIVE